MKHAYRHNLFLVIVTLKQYYYYYYYYYYYSYVTNKKLRFKGEMFPGQMVNWQCGEGRNFPLLFKILLISLIIKPT